MYGQAARANVRAVSDDKSPETPSIDPDPELKAALEEAAEAIPSEETEAADAKGDAGEAVTEAMLIARRELQRALEQTRKEAERFHANWLRAAADLENYRKRATKERDEVVKFGNESLLKDFLPVVDDLERTVEVVSQTAPEGDQLLEGVRLVHKKLMSQLEKHGVQGFDSKGTGFDPALHEAVQQTHDEAEAGTVVTEFQRGFKLNDRLLRPSMVVVSLGPKS